MVEQRNAELSPDVLRREILYRSRRSILEMDRIIGDFVRTEIENLPDALLPSLRDMLHEMDQNLLASWREEIETPAEYAEVFAQMRSFHAR